MYTPHRCAREYTITCFITKDAPENVPMIQLRTSTSTKLFSKTGPPVNSITIKNLLRKNLEKVEPAGGFHTYLSNN